MATTNMALTLPTPTITAGPDWAEALNTALTTIDSHDHSTGKGAKVTPSGLNINADLSIGTTNNLTLVRSMRLVSQGSVLALPTDLGCISNIGGNLYWNNNSGTAVQLTSGGSPVAASDGIARAFETVAISSNTTINPSDTGSFYEIDCGTSVTLTLPSAAAVTAGRYYEFKDVTNEAGSNNITIARNGSDTINGAGSDITVDYNGGGGRLISDGVSDWHFSTKTDTAQIETKQIKDANVTTAKIADSNVTTSKIADGAVTQAKRAALGQQISSSSGSYSTTSATFVDVTNLTVSITTTGRPVYLGLVWSGTGSGFIGARDTSGSVGAFANIQVLRDSTAVSYGVVGGNLNLTSGGADEFRAPLGSIWHIDVPSAGTYTYKVQIAMTGTSVTGYVSNAKLIAYEL